MSVVFTMAIYKHAALYFTSIRHKLTANFGKVRMKLQTAFALAASLPLFAGCASAPAVQQHQPDPPVLGITDEPLALTEAAVGPETTFIQPVLKDDHVVAPDPFATGGRVSFAAGQGKGIQRGTKDGLVWLMAGDTQGRHPSDVESRLAGQAGAGGRGRALGAGQGPQGGKGHGELVVWFDFADPRPAPRYKSSAGSLAALRTSRSVVVVGHTDAVGTDAANMVLARKRAEHVRDWLVAHGVPAASIRLVSKGESAPVASNATAEGRAQNRRVEVYAGD